MTALLEERVAAVEARLARLGALAGAGDSLSRSSSSSSGALAVLSGEGPPGEALGAKGQFYVETGGEDEPLALFGPKHEALTYAAAPTTAGGAPPAGYQGTGAAEHHVILGGTVITNSEAWGKVGVPPLSESSNQSLNLYLRAAANGSHQWTSGYQIKIGGTFVAVYKPSGRIAEKTLHAIETGDTIWARMIGHILTVYRKPAASEKWETLLSIYDTEYATGETGAGTWEASETFAEYGAGAPEIASRPTWGGIFAGLGSNRHEVIIAPPTGTAASDTANVKAALNETVIWQKAHYQFAAGKYLINETLTLSSYSQFEGAGQELTTLELAAGSNVPLIQSEGFAGLVGSKKGGGIYGWAVKNMTLDGNGAEQNLKTGAEAASGEKQCWPLRVYGYFGVIENVTINHGGPGALYSEWSQAEGWPPGETENEQGDRVETRLRNCHFNNYYGPEKATAEESFESVAPTYGIYWNGPHDSMWESVFVSSYRSQHENNNYNRVFGVYIGTGALNLMTVNLHIFGRHSHTLYHAKEAKGEHANLYPEAGSIACVVVSSGTTISGCFIIGLGGQEFKGTLKGINKKEAGIQLGDTAEAGVGNVPCGSAQLNGIYVENFAHGSFTEGEYEGKGIRFTNDSGANTVNLVFAGTAAHLYAGTYSNTDTLGIVPSSEPANGLFQHGGSCQIFTNTGEEEVWTRPAGATVCTVVCIAGGGGGASGSTAAAKAASKGGGGGGGGGFSSNTFALGSVVNFKVKVGKGGAGGLARAGNSEAGESGKGGGASNVSAAAYCNAGEGINGTAAAGGAGGAGMTQAGGAGGTPSAEGAGGSATTLGMVGAGGAGGSISTAEAAGKGGNGSNGSANMANAGAGGTGEAGKPGSKAANAKVAVGGGGGGGGGANAAGNAYAGGEGGLYGAGGGGGGAALNGHESGAGGAGAQGVVIVSTA
jgi:hypothetical protein